MIVRPVDVERPFGPAPGWYADPEHAGSERYWDGHRWAEQRRPAPAADVVGAGAGNGFAVTSLVCGIVGTVLGVLPFFVGWILGIIAIVATILWIVLPAAVIDTSSDYNYEF